MTCSIDQAAWNDLAGGSVGAGDPAWYTSNFRTWLVKGVPGKAEGDSVGGVEATDIEDLNNAITTMTTDVNMQASDARQKGGELAVVLTEFQGRWTDFVMRWNVWFTEHQTFLSRQFEANVDFAAFRAEYEQKHEEWIALGQTTNAAGHPGAPSSPLDSIPWGTILVIGSIALGAWWLTAGGGLMLLASRSAH